MSGYFSLTENSGRVSGMGSAEDPFLVSDLDTFRWAIHQSCEYVKLCADLDYSELEYWTGITVNASVVDLNGHTIKNINITPVTADGNFFMNTPLSKMTICNGVIQSISGTSVDYLFRGTLHGYGTVGALYFKNLQISGTITAYNSNGIFDNYDSYPGYMNFDKVSLNIAVQNTVSCSVFRPSSTTKHDNCNYHLNVTIGASDGIGGTFTNSKLTGSVQLVSTSSNYLFNSLASSVIACNITPGDEKTLYPCAKSCTAVTIIDKNLISGAYDTPAKVKYLTTEQMKDADYLTNVAEFPVYEV